MVTTAFHDCFYVNTSQVKSNNNPLTYLLTVSHFDATGHQWVAQLAKYNFSIQYKMGKTNIKANALPRISWDWMISNEAARAILDAIIEGTISLVEVYAENMHVATAIPDEVLPPCNLSPLAWDVAQEQEPGLEIVSDLYKSKRLYLVKMANYDLYDVKAYIRQRECLRLREDVLYILPKES